MPEVTGGKPTLICIKMYKKNEGNLAVECNFPEVSSNVAITTFS